MGKITWKPLFRPSIESGTARTEICSDSSAVYSIVSSTLVINYDTNNAMHAV